MSAPFELLTHTTQVPVGVMFYPEFPVTEYLYYIPAYYLDPETPGYRTLEQTMQELIDFLTEEANPPCSKPT